jgi:hypothetical protein
LTAQGLDVATRCRMDSDGLFECYDALVDFSVVLVDLVDTRVDVVGDKAT